jgi:small subunit ribosomal protein S6
MLKRYQDLVTKNGGKIHRVEDIGRLKLAYTIKDMQKAHYVLMNLECDNQTLSEITSSFEFNDSIMRHLVVRMANAETDPSKLFMLHGKDPKKKQVDSKITDKRSNTDQDKIKSTKAIDQESKQDLDVKSETALTESDAQVTAKKNEVEVDEKV